MDVDQRIAMQGIACAIFLIAVLHTFVANKISGFGSRFTPGSFGENFFHLLGEIEIVFGFWAGVLVLIWSVRFGGPAAVDFVESRVYTEAVFVFVIMCLASTQPILDLSRRLVTSLANLLPVSHGSAFYIAALTAGPLLGSLITEPAAMTVTALLLREFIFKRENSSKLRYATLGLLFVNVSIGGTLSHFAAPPVVMVAKIWQWDFFYMLSHFGWKAALSVAIGTVATAWYFRSELASLSPKQSDGMQRTPLWVIGVHLGFLLLAVLTAHHVTILVAVFLFFVGWLQVSEEYQTELRLKESLLVGFFLAGLVTLGSMQEFWIRPLIGSVNDWQLFLGATGLTSITDNAALTYLGTLVVDLSDHQRYLLVAGAVTGGGLTVIANAPNPAGYGLLKGGFGDDGISAVYLALAALPWTVLAALLFWFF